MNGFPWLTIAGRLGLAGLPWPIVQDARRMLKSRGPARRSYGRNGERGRADVEVWMQSQPAAGRAIVGEDDGS